MAKRFFIYFIIVFLLAVNVNAFLISPPKIEIQFQPGLTQEFTITLFNNRQETITLETYVKYIFLSEEAKLVLDGSVTIDTPKITFEPSDATKSFKAKITLPDSIPEGIHDIRVGAVEEAIIGIVGSRSANEVRVLIFFGQDITPSSITTSSILTQPFPGLPGGGTGPGSGLQPGQEQPGLIVGKTPGIFTFQVVTTFIVTFLLLLLIALFLLLMKRKKESLVLVSLKSDSKKSDEVSIEAVARNTSLNLIDNIYLDFQIIDKESNIVKTINVGPIKIKPRSEGVINRTWDSKGIKKGKYILKALLYHHKKVLIKNQQFILT